jgi:hypothetical protein
MALRLALQHGNRSVSPVSVTLGGVIKQAAPEMESGVHLTV